MERTNVRCYRIKFHDQLFLDKPFHQSQSQKHENGWAAKQAVHYTVRRLYRHMDSDAPTDADLKKLRGEVYAYPTDLRLRFRLGAALSMRQDYHAAIPELKKGTWEPNVRLSAMKLLVEAYEATGKFDLAAQLREQLSRESGDESGSGSAPVPAPIRPITPRDSSRAEKRPREDDDA